MITNNILLDKEGKKYLVKRLRSSDAESLSNLLNSFSTETIKLFRPHSFDAVFINNLLKNKNDIRLGLYTINKKKLIAYAFVDKIPLCGIGYFGIGISEEFQGHGLAPKLMNYLFYVSKKRGINKIILNIYKENIKAMRLYKTNGFKVFKIDPLSRIVFGIYGVLKNNNLQDLTRVFSGWFFEKRENKSSVVWMIRNF